MRNGPLSIPARIISSLLILSPTLTFAQGTLPLDPAGYVEFQLKTLAVIKTSELQHSRYFIAQQIGLVAPDQRASVTKILPSKLNDQDKGTKFNVAAILALYPTSWSTSDTNGDAQGVYSMILNESDLTYKSILDNVLANGKGLYRDAVKEYAAGTISGQKAAEPKLRTMSLSYPKSTFAENASFFLALDLTNQYILTDPRDPSFRKLHRSRPKWATCKK
jgi:TolA-binding protein